MASGSRVKSYYNKRDLDKARATHKYCHRVFIWYIHNYSDSVGTYQNDMVQFYCASCKHNACEPSVWHVSEQLFVNLETGHG